uniref:Uncharacterized protein n=1 Tax=Panagrolaimus davidi TaxID=227884 RepID=A0A914QYL2_9BILA
MIFYTTVPQEFRKAKVFPFVLDVFQKKAISCIEANQSVLVAAHTSAGKTVVAEYAIALALKKKMRIIYTSPIKALSNQKFRDFQNEFGDVGLMTGDVTIKPDASCIVMTTEVLRSMLYRGSEIMLETGWIIFDEVHYMRDKDRGFVWEESITLLNDRIKCVFLSATLPNYNEFASWFCVLHNQPCNVVCTDYRPTPLRHFVHPVGSDGIYEVVGNDGVFCKNKFDDAMKCFSDSIVTPTPKKLKLNSVLSVLKTVHEKNLMPCIVFSFSRKECEDYANSMTTFDFVPDENIKQNIDNIFLEAVKTLSETDRNLPQVKGILPCLLRGIGVHHSGLLPVLKEVTEILFSQGYIKVLFATETFAIGLNMPARTVVFTSCRKFDGTEYRSISSGEYIQMSGRAGRRGKDKNGIVILLCDEIFNSETAKNLINGGADPLNSQFRLTYNMILNLLRADGTDPSSMLKKSFLYFQKEFTLSGMYQLQGNTKLADESVIDRYQILLNELEGRQRVLQQLQFCSKEGFLMPKGKFACVISATDELLLTEIIFDNFFRGLDVAKSAALLSCFVCHETNEYEYSEIPEMFIECYQKLQEKAKKIVEASKEYSIEIDMDVNSFQPHMMKVVYSWIQGESFGEICSENSQIFEGNIILCLRRLEELLRQVIAGILVMQHEEEMKNNLKQVDQKR